MDEIAQFELLASVTDIDLAQMLLADLHDDLSGKVARSRQLADICQSMGREGTMLTGGEITYAIWTEARVSFIHGNFVATVMLCQGLAEHLLASYLALPLEAEALPKRVAFKKTLSLCVVQNVINDKFANELSQLMELRNPLSHYRGIDDPTNLTRRALNTENHAENLLFGDASFAIGVAVRLLSLPQFRLDK